MLRTLFYFLSIIFLLSFAMNFYVFARFYGFFNLKKNPVFWSAVSICAISLIAASFLHTTYGNLFSKITYTISTGWYGILWLLFCALIVYEILNLFIKIKPHAAGSAILTIVALTVIYSIINAQLVRVKTITIPGPANTNIVQLSDVHIGSVTGHFLKRVINKTNALNPDMVLITGDLVDNHSPATEKAIALLNNLNAPTYYVTGNHEYYAGIEKIIKAIKAANVTVLDNQLVDLGEIQIIGIDYKTKDFDQTIKSLNITPSAFSILMYHVPLELETAAKHNIDLTLTGHTHHGQIFPFNFIVRLFHPYLSGLHHHNNSYIYGSPGTGTWGPRMRLGSRSEILLLKIKTAAQS